MHNQQPALKPLSSSLKPKTAEVSSHSAPSVYEKLPATWLAKRDHVRTVIESDWAKPTGRLFAAAHHSPKPSFFTKKDANRRYKKRKVRLSGKKMGATTNDYQRRAAA
ncbi:hypothetical protein [Pseudomonas amygdali]|uniref:hypothetical protein n=1 Tax=Pseudomonas amygdali TaxID=47877 RepID=UPI001FB25F4A|nr:hypothetical protein [Pseudomonas amygdali]UNO28641.1 hypothetical protein MDO45_22720 [Pseudomonas amygdali pv. aesculi]